MRTGAWRLVAGTAAVTVLGGWTGCLHREPEPGPMAILEITPDHVDGTWDEGATFTLTNVGGSDSVVPEVVASLDNVERCSPGVCAEVDTAIDWAACSSPGSAPPSTPHPLAAGESCPGTVSVSGIDTFTADVLLDDGTITVSGGPETVGDSVLLTFAP